MVHIKREVAMAKIVCPECGGLKYKETFSTGTVSGSILCPRCVGAGEIEDDSSSGPSVLKFPAVNARVKKREVPITTLGDLANLVSYLDLKNAQPLTPIYSENREKLSAAIWEGIEGGFSIEIRVVKEC